MSNDDGQWIIDGGRLMHIPLSDALEDEQSAFGHTIADLQGETLLNHVPEGASESAIAHVMLGWLDHQQTLRMEAISMFLLAERQRKRGLPEDGLPNRRRNEPAPESQFQEDIAFQEGAAQWFDDARQTLLGEMLHSGSRAMTEWYMWVLGEGSAMKPIDEQDHFGSSRLSGRAEAIEDTRRYTERLVMPEDDD